MFNANNLFGAQPNVPNAPGGAGGMANPNLFAPPNVQPAQQQQPQQQPQMPMGGIPGAAFSAIPNLGAAGLAANVAAGGNVFGGGGGVVPPGGPVGAGGGDAALLAALAGLGGGAGVMPVLGGPAGLGPGGPGLGRVGITLSSRLAFLPIRPWSMMCCALGVSRMHIDPA